jgi:hypothetical protein
MSVTAQTRSSKGVWSARPRQRGGDAMLKIKRYATWTAIYGAILLLAAFSLWSP